jgi:4-aminobutyrate aminotransferase-like enzyme
LAGGNQRIWQLAGIVVEGGSGAIMLDADGNEYIDFVAAMCVGALGYGDARHARAIATQAEKVIIGGGTSAPRASLLKRIAELTPTGANLTKTQMYSGGAEAVESAIRLAKSYTEKEEVVGFWGGFHGKTAGVLGLMGSELKHGFGTMAPGLHVVPYADCYRCPFGVTYPSCGVLCAEFARQSIKRQTTNNVAAIIAEPIQGQAGEIPPPKEFLPAIKSIAEEIGALYISDEMITGFGRTGKMFGCEHSGVKPDVMTIGKSLGGGFPVTGVVSTPEITKAQPWSWPGASSSSYGGNPLAAAAADASLEIIVKDDLVGNARRVGGAMMEALQKMIDRYPFVGTVRGAGLMLSLELVSDKKTKKPLPIQARERILLAALRRGLFANPLMSRVRIDPPLVITMEQAMEGVDILDEVFQEIEKTGGWR